MILVDTSVWIDHLHRPLPTLVELLESDQVATHSWVIEELALGALKNRQTFIHLLEHLVRFPVLSHNEMLQFLENNHLYGKGLSTIDVHLMGSIRLVESASLWTRDKRLIKACQNTDVALFAD